MTSSKQSGGREEPLEIVRADGKPYCGSEREWLGARIRCMRERGHSGKHLNGLSHTIEWPQESAPSSPGGQLTVQT